MNANACGKEPFDLNGTIWIEASMRLVWGGPPQLQSKPVKFRDETNKGLVQGGLTSFLWCVLILLSSCATPGEYANRAEAIEFTQRYSSEINTFRGLLLDDFSAIYDHEAKRKAWADRIAPALRSTGVRRVRLFHVDRDAYDAPGSDDGTLVTSRTIYQDLPEPDVTEVSGGWMTVGNLYRVDQRGDVEVRASRGRCELNGSKYVIYSFVVGEKKSDFWLDCEFLKRVDG